MANSWHAFVLFIGFTLIVFDLNHAAVRRRRSFPNVFGQLGLGRNVETTTHNLFQGHLGILSVNVVGGQKNNANNPCDPSQYIQQASTVKPGLINIKIPSFFSRGRGNQQPTVPPECPPTGVYPTGNPNVKPDPSGSTGGYQSSESPVQRPTPSTSTYLYVTSSIATSTDRPIMFPEPIISSSTASPPARVTKPPPPTPQLVQSSTSSSSPSSTNSVAIESTTQDLEKLIDSIFNQEDAQKPNDNNGAGIIDLRWRGKQSK